MLGSHVFLGGVSLRLAGAQGIQGGGNTGVTIGDKDNCEDPLLNSLCDLGFSLGFRVEPPTWLQLPLFAPCKTKNLKEDLRSTHVVVFLNSRTPIQPLKL